MKIGFVGLGKMGYQIVAKLLQAGNELVVYDVDESAISRTVAIGAKPATSREDLVSQLGSKPIVWLMIPPDFVPAEIAAIKEVLPNGATIIDGGNTNYQQTIKHGQDLAEKKINLIDVGTSGGILGLENGFSLMVGGPKILYENLKPVFDTLSEPNGAHCLVGPVGYGHYVKMIHNGIEYGVMQALAEGYELLQTGPLSNVPLAKVANTWQKGSIIESTLNKLIAEIMHENPNLVGMDGFVADSGEGQWTLETAEQAGINMPALKDALMVRRASQQGETSYATQLLAALRNKFGGHTINKL